MATDGIEQALRATDSLLKSQQARAVFIGGLALAVTAEPRMTQDVDVIVFLDRKRLSAVLDAATMAGFEFNRSTVLADIQERGCYAMSFGGIRIDVILSSTPLEESIWSRRVERKLLGLTLSFPTPEDLILLKLVPGRPKDLLDAQSVVSAHGPNLDRAYLRTWAERLDEQSESSRFSNWIRDFIET